eukprot:scaffold128202_cov57-Phaeocystis_antarctica.AAC.2
MHTSSVATTYSGPSAPTGSCERGYGSSGSGCAGGLCWPNSSGASGPAASWAHGTAAARAGTSPSIMLGAPQAREAKM